MIIDMSEAMRLTRAGRLTEATALLRGRSVHRAPPPMPTAPRGWRDARTKTTRVPNAEPTPQGGRFIANRFDDRLGGRDYKLYVPSGHHGEALPLVVMLHGCTQSADDFAVGTRMNLRAEETGFYVVYPEQPASANCQKCWNWFKATDQQRDRGEPSLIAGITRRIATQYPIDPARIFVAGLSSGGAAAATMASTYPELYAAVGVHSGLAHGAASDVVSAFMAMQSGSRGIGSERGAPHAARIVRTIVFHGDKDRTVHPRNGDQVIAQARSRGASPERFVATVVNGLAAGRAYRCTRYADDGRIILEHWVVSGVGHAWSGGSPAGSYTDSKGPDATREMLRFFFEGRPAHEIF